MKKIEVRLTDWRWTESARGGLRWRGVAFADGMIHRTPEQIASRLPQHDASPQTWGKAISMFNGFFSLVWRNDTQVVAAVDRIRGFPLFYAQSPDALFLSDDAEWVRQQIGDEAMDPVARDEFQLTGYVTGRDTLYPNVKQLQAGELLLFDSTQASSEAITYRYFRYLHVEPSSYDEGTLRKKLEDLALASVGRLIAYADGRQIVVPLSGGYDSRLIVTLLSKLGYKNIVAFSYGVEGDKEAAYSKQVAHALGLTWHFVEYGAEQWRRAWDTEERRHYQKWASGLVSIPHIQDWVAVRTLRANRMIDENCIFVPGHICTRRNTGVPDTAPAKHELNPELLARMVMKSHYRRSAGKSGPKPKLEIWKERVLDRAEATSVGSLAELSAGHEQWEWQERQSKFICNSVRVYEFFGYEWWLPLWDAEFMEFWLGVPLQLRTRRHWYNDYVKRTYAAQTGGRDQDWLNNAGEIGRLGKMVRSTVKKLPKYFITYIDGLRQRVMPKRMSKAYFVQHISASEFKRLQSEGYRGDDMLVYEFLGMLSQTHKQGSIQMRA